MSYFVPFGKTISTKPIKEEIPWFADRKLNRLKEKDPNIKVIDVFEEDQTASSEFSKRCYIYVIDVPEGITEKNIKVNLSDDQKQINVLINMRKHDNTRSTEKAIVFPLRTTHHLDIKNVNAHLDKRTNQIIIYSPYFINNQKNNEENVDILGF